MKSRLEQAKAEISALKFSLSDHLYDKGVDDCIAILDRIYGAEPTEGEVERAHNAYWKASSEMNWREAMKAALMTVFGREEE